MNYLTVFTNPQPTGLQLSESVQVLQVLGDQVELLDTRRISWQLAVISIL